MGDTASIGLQGLGGGLQAGAEQGAGKIQNTIYKFNSKIQNLQAQDAIDIGLKKEQNFRKKVKKFAADQRLAFAAQGIDIESGTALDVQMDTAEQGEIDALTIRNNAYLEAWGYKVGAENSKTQGEFAELSGEMASMGTILSTASNIYASIK